MSHAQKFAPVAVAFLALAGGARAADRPFNIAFDLGAATDYEFRGVSQTDNRPNIFGAANLAIGTLGYAGGWVSNVDLPGGATTEYDLYAGVRPKIGPVSLDLGVVRYGYAGQGSGPRLDYTEWKVAPSMDLGPATFGLAYFHSEDFQGRRGPSNYLEANASTSISGTPVSVSGAIGRQQVKGPDDYTTWNLGLSYAVNDHLGFDLRYWDTDAHGLGRIYDSKLVLGVKATFP